MTVSNCATLVDFKTCGECNVGFYLTSDRLCKANPPEIIKNCLHYSSNTTCVECVD